MMKKSCDAGDLEGHDHHTTLQPPLTTNLPEPEIYSIYSRKEKRILVAMVGVAGLFSPLPANIYFPAIPALATAFNSSAEDMNLTVTIYLAMQGCSPMLWGPLSDRIGRRPMFLLCLLILMGSSLGLALCPTSSFWLLLLLRAVQAGGCASTIALGAGAIGDIASVDERGGFFGMFNLGPMLAPCIGPAVGGVLSQHLGWRSIFWFLTIFSVLCFAVLLLFLPETNRGLVGNGSVRPSHRLYRPLLSIIIRSGQSNTPGESSGDAGSSRASTSARPQRLNMRTNPFRLLAYPDILLALTYTGIVYAVNYTIMSTISSTFTVHYPSLSETLIGICYLSSGLGMILGSTVTGKLLDLDFARIKKKQLASSLGTDDESLSHDDPSFPIEYARLRMMPVLLLVFAACTVGWGWCIQLNSSLAGPLLLQVALGWTSIAILNATMTLMIDIIRDQSSGVIACTNLVRCSLAALLVSLIDKATRSLGYGWTYTLLGGVCALQLLPIYVEMRVGKKWRLGRIE